MSVDSYLMRSVVFVICFSIATYGLVNASGGVLVELNWITYFINVGSLFFAGAFCIGRANRYLLLTFVAILIMSFGFVMLMDVVLPLSAYLRVNMFPVVSYIGLVMMMRRNQLTMKLNKVRNGHRDTILRRALNFCFRQDLPTRETNMSLMMYSFAKVYVAVDLAFAFVSVMYYNYLGLDFYELFMPYVYEKQAINLPLIRDSIITFVDIAVIIIMITNVLHDGRRPDSLGIGQTAIYDKYRLKQIQK